MRIIEDTCSVEFWTSRISSGVLRIHFNVDGDYSSGHIDVAGLSFELGAVERFVELIQVGVDPKGVSK